MKTWPVSKPLQKKSILLMKINIKHAHSSKEHHSSKGSNSTLLLYKVTTAGSSGVYMYFLLHSFGRTGM